MKLLQEHSATLVSMLHGSHSGEIQVEVPRPQQGEQPWQQPEQQPGQQHGRNPQEQGRQRRVQRTSCSSFGWSPLSKKTSCTGMP